MREKKKKTARSKRASDPMADKKQSQTGFLNTYGTAARRHVVRALVNREELMLYHNAAEREGHLVFADWIRVALTKRAQDVIYGGGKERGKI